MVKLSLEMKKRDVVWVSLVVVLLGVGVVFAATAWDATKTVFHSADDVKVSVGGTDYSLQEAVTEGLIGGGSGGFSCDTGFTKIGNLGCMQDAESGTTGTWENNMDTCASMGGGMGRLPTYLEWYTGVRYYSSSVTDVRSSEWLFDADPFFTITGARDSGYHLVATSDINSPEAVKNSASYDFRCFIPASGAGSGGADVLPGTLCGLDKYQVNFGWSNLNACNGVSPNSRTCPSGYTNTRVDLVGMGYYWYTCIKD